MASVPTLTSIYTMNKSAVTSSTYGDCPGSLKPLIIFGTDTWEITDKKQKCNQIFQKYVTEEVNIFEKPLTTTMCLDRNMYVNHLSSRHKNLITMVFIHLCWRLRGTLERRASLVSWLFGEVSSVSNTPFQFRLVEYIPYRGWLRQRDSDQRIHEPQLRFDSLRERSPISR